MSIKDYMTSNNCDKAIADISKGNIEALTVIYDLMSKKIYSVAWSILKNHQDSEDVVQETLKAILDKADLFNYKSKASTWIIAIARNQALLKLRSRKNHYDIDDYVNVIDNENFVDEPVSNMIYRDALSILPQDEREIVVLKIFNKMKYKEIAELLEITVSSAEKKYQRACKKLFDYFK